MNDSRNPRHAAAAMAATIVAAFVLLLAVAGFARVGTEPQPVAVTEANNADR